MPRSKKRKIFGKTVKRQEVKYVPPEMSKSWELKIKASQIHYLKSDPDFLAFIKAGRMLNAILFASTPLVQYVADESHHFGHRRRYC